MKSKRVAKNTAVVLLILQSLILPANQLSAHSGGTDKYGCHGGSLAYHCHVSEVSESTKAFIKNRVFNGMTKGVSFVINNKRYSNCKLLNQRYLRGVAKSETVIDKLTGGYGYSYYIAVSESMYLLNRHLDLNNNGIACGFLEPENPRTVTFLCGDQQESAAPELSSGDSYSRCKSKHQHLEGWRIRVVSITPNANTAIKAESHTDYRPTAGKQYFLATLRITNLNTFTASFEDTWLGTVAQDKSEYNHFRNSCGLTPLEFVSLPQKPLESRTGNFCWEIDATDANNLTLFWGYPRGVRTYISLR